MTGTLDVSGADVRGIFKCRGCTFTGAVEASDATFERTVDLSGSLFRDTVDFSGTTFRAPALFRIAPVEEGTSPKERQTTFSRDADFSLATFEDLSSFADSVYKAAGTFRDTRFADVTFASATFGQEGVFERASFRGVANFNRAQFEGEARFTESDFRRGAHFVQTKFLAVADFASAQFAEGASFLNARFEPSRTSEEAARFQDVTSEDSLDFTFARFALGEGATPSQGRVIAIFSGVVSGRSVVFRDTTFAPGNRITMSNLQAGDLVLDVDAVPQIDDRADQRSTLAMIEESAKARGDLGTANDAHYALLASRSEDYRPPFRVLDVVFYRGIAGYFVRPFRPLLVLLGLAVAFSIWRFARRPRAAPSGGGSLRRLWRRVRAAVSDLLDGFLDTLSSIKSGRIAAEGEPTVGERIEVFVYRLLLACALLGLANSNPTLREMFDTLV